MAYTQKQLDEFREISWWNLKEIPLKILFDKWKKDNNLTNQDLDDMLDEILS